MKSLQKPPVPFAALALVFCSVVLVSAALAQPSPKTSPTKSASQKIPTTTLEAHRAQLQRALAQLKKIESPSRVLAPIVKSLAKTQKIKRRDGQIQTSGGDRWERWLDARGPGAVPPNSATGNQTYSREDVRKIREDVEERLRALDEWSASAYVSEDAQRIIAQLEGSGQIRTGPTWLQQLMADFWKWVSDTWLALLKWIGSLFPSATPGKLPSIDPFWVKLVFTLCVGALLAILVILVWRAVGGRVGRRGARKGIFTEGEDAELLVLPPDELRARAARFAAEGNFREALRHLYISLLLTLDARGVWRYDARRTNWEHIAALRSDASRSTLVVPLSNITRVFDRVRYGNADFAANDWNRFESEVTSVETQTQS